MIAPDIVGMAEIAARLKVPRGTVKAWLYRNQLPPSDLTVNDGPAWYWTTILLWHRNRRPYVRKTAV